jgi:hypothetical protein
MPQVPLGFLTAESASALGASTLGTLALGASAREDLALGGFELGDLVLERADGLPPPLEDALLLAPGDLAWLDRLLTAMSFRTLTLPVQKDADLEAGKGSNQS